MVHCGNLDFQWSLMCPQHFLLSASQTWGLFAMGSLEGFHGDTCPLGVEGCPFWVFPPLPCEMTSVGFICFQLVLEKFTLWLS